MNNQRMVLKCCTVLLMLVALVQVCSAQKQLVLLHGQQVRLRLVPGDDFVYRLKGSKKIHRSYINNIYDTAVMAHLDVIPFYKIDRVYFEHRSFANKVGGALVIGGVGYFLIDQINTVLVHGDPATLDRGVTTTSAVMVGAGLPLWLIRKRSQRLDGRFRLMLAEPGSPFYRTPPQQFFQD